MRHWPARVNDLYLEQGVAGLETIPGVGPGIARAIRELIIRGRLPMVDRLRGHPGVAGWNACASASAIWSRRRSPAIRRSRPDRVRPVRGIRRRLEHGAPPECGYAIKAEPCARVPRPGKIVRSTGVRMRLLHLLALGVFAATLGSTSAVAGSPAVFGKDELSERFLLQVNYEQKSSRQDFKTSRSRIVTFRREGPVLHMLDLSDPRDSVAPRILATIPIRSETRSSLTIDLNEGFDTVYLEEDRTGEDYYGRIDKHDDTRFRLFDRKVKSVSRHDATLVFDQEATTDDGESIVVHYYLSRYRPSPHFQPFEMQNLRRFGFYETYPQWRSGRWVLFAMKFDIHEPIVFALSSAIPESRRAAVRDGVLYWNRALRRTALQVINAPPGIRAPSPDYNLIQWTTSGDYASTSYIQSDPLTGQILHAHVFLLPDTMMDGDLEQQNDHLRYIVAHEIGHALGLRHNFAAGDATTVMDYYKLPQLLSIGREIRTRAPALAYDAAVIQHVYLGTPLAADTLPPFCTDSQRGCLPFRSTVKETDGMRGESGAATP